MSRPDEGGELLTRRPSFPVLGSAPWRRAPLLLWRHPATLLAVAGATAVLAVAAAGQPFYVSSTDAGAFASQMAQRCPGTMGISVTAAVAPAGAAAESAALARRAAVDLAQAGARSDALEAPVSTLAAAGLPVSAPGGRSSVITLYDRGGDTGHVHVLRRATGEGLWITDSTAALLGVSAGDTIEMAGTVPVRVAAVYANLQDAPRPLPSFWCSEESGRPGFIGPPDADFPPPPLALADRPEFLRLAAALHLGDVSFQWQRGLPRRAVTAEQARAVARALTSVRRQLPPPAFERGGEAQAVPTDAGFVVARAGAIGESVAHSVSPVTLAGVMVAMLLMASAGSYWLDRRRVEVTLLRARGVSAAMIGVKAALEMAPWAVSGAAAGVALARLLVRLLGPSPVVSPPSLWTGVRDAAGATAAGILVLGSVAALLLASSRRWGVTRSKVSRLLPVELAVLALAGVTWWHLSGTNADVAPAGSSVASVSPLLLAFPVLVVIGTTALVASLAARSASAARRWAARRNTGLFLGVARLAASPDLGASLFGAAGTAVGMLVFAAALTSTQQQTVAAKARTFVGSETAVYLTSPTPVPSSLRATTTEVVRLPDASVGNEVVDVVGIDPATFGRAAFWSSAYGAGSPAKAASLVSSAPSPPGTLPAIVANGSLGAHPSLQVPTATGPVTVRLRVLEGVPGFTLANGSDVLVVTDIRSLRGFATQPELLSRSNANTVLRAVARAGGGASVVVRADDVLDQTEFLSVSWSFSYLQALGALVGLIAVAGTFLYVETRQRRRAAGYAMVQRMGLSRRGHLAAVAVELGAPVLGGAAFGMASGVGTAALVFGSLDPLPGLPPGPVLCVPVVVLAGIAAAALVTWSTAMAWAQRGVERVSPAAVLRGAQ